ncbi:MAG: hypothetical protein U9N59_09060 [Campylobacterota bacterium]|nr:hypothetical protein [Campylobacterota bacterium]
MYKFPSQKDITKAVINGIVEARDNYTFWTSNKTDLLDADDDFITVHICQNIAAIHNPPEIFIHANISDILKCSLNTREEYKYFMKEHLLSQDTISITLDERFKHQIDNDSISKVLISVKNGVVNSKKEHTNKIEQLCKLLQREKKEDSTLDYAIFAFYLEISDNARIGALQRIDNIISAFDDIVKNYPNLKSTFKGGDINTSENTGQWCVGCYIIEPNK